jgi:hypothetical protein
MTSSTSADQAVSVLAAAAFLVTGENDIMSVASDVEEEVSQQHRSMSWTCHKRHKVWFNYIKCSACMDSWHLTTAHMFMLSRADHVSCGRSARCVTIRTTHILMVCTLLFFCATAAALLLAAGASLWPCAPR